MIVWEHTDTEFAVFCVNLHCFRRRRPRYNVQGQPQDSRYVYVGIGRTPAPYVFVTASLSIRTLACFGLLFLGRRLREAIRWVNDGFRLRDCPQTQEVIFADRGALLPVVRAAGCLRFEIGTCLGPCTGDVLSPPTGSEPVRPGLSWAVPIEHPCKCWNAP